MLFVELIICLGGMVIIPVIEYGIDLFIMTHFIIHFMHHHTGGMILTGMEDIIRPSFNIERMIIQDCVTRVVEGVV
jgi:hypothetical protein